LKSNDQGKRQIEVKGDDPSITMGAFTHTNKEINNTHLRQKNFAIPARGKR